MSVPPGGKIKEAVKVDLEKKAILKAQETEVKTPSIGSFFKRAPYPSSTLAMKKFSPDLTLIFRRCL